MPTSTRLRRYGGAHAASYPASTLYAHLGQSTVLYDVTKGGNGYCDGEAPTTCGEPEANDHDHRDDGPERAERRQRGERARRPPASEGAEHDGRRDDGGRHGPDHRRD